MPMQQESKEDTKSFFDEHLDMLEKLYIVKSRLWGINNHPFNETSEAEIKGGILKKLEDIKNITGLSVEYAHYSSRLSLIIQYWI